MGLEFQYATKAETPLSKAEMWAFEKRFNEAKFVHSVLFSVADDMHMNLKVTQYVIIYFLKMVTKGNDFLVGCL